MTLFNLEKYREESIKRLDNLLNIKEEGIKKIPNEMIELYKNEYTFDFLYRLLNFHKNDLEKYLSDFIRKEQDNNLNKFADYFIDYYLINYLYNKNKPVYKELIQIYDIIYKDSIDIDFIRRFLEDSLNSDSSLNEEYNNLVISHFEDYNNNYIKNLYNISKDKLDFVSKFIYDKFHLYIRLLLMLSTNNDVYHSIFIEPIKDSLKGVEFAFIIQPLNMVLHRFSDIFYREVYTIFKRDNVEGIREKLINIYDVLITESVKAQNKLLEKDNIINVYVEELSDFITVYINNLSNIIKEKTEENTVVNAFREIMLLFHEYSESFRHNVSKYLTIVDDKNIIMFTKLDKKDIEVYKRKESIYAYPSNIGKFVKSFIYNFKNIMLDIHRLDDKIKNKFYININRLQINTYPKIFSEINKSTDLFANIHSHLQEIIKLRLKENIHYLARYIAVASKIDGNFYKIIRKYIRYAVNKENKDLKDYINFEIYEDISEYLFKVIENNKYTNNIFKDTEPFKHFINQLLEYIDQIISFVSIKASYKTVSFILAYIMFNLLKYGKDKNEDMYAANAKNFILNVFINKPYLNKKTLILDKINLYKYIYKILFGISSIDKDVEDKNIIINNITNFIKNRVIATLIDAGIDTLKLNLDIEQINEETKDLIMQDYIEYKHNFKISKYLDRKLPSLYFIPIRAIKELYQNKTKIIIHYDRNIISFYRKMLISKHDKDEFRLVYAPNNVLKIFSKILNFFIANAVDERKNLLKPLSIEIIGYIRKLDYLEKLKDIDLTDKFLTSIDFKNYFYQINANKIKNLNISKIILEENYKYINDIIKLFSKTFTFRKKILEKFNLSKSFTHSGIKYLFINNIFNMNNRLEPGIYTIYFKNNNNIVYNNIPGVFNYLMKIFLEISFNIMAIRRKIILYMFDNTIRRVYHNINSDTFITSNIYKEINNNKSDNIMIEKSDFAVYNIENIIYERNHLSNIIEFIPFVINDYILCSAITPSSNISVLKQFYIDNLISFKDMYIIDSYILNTERIINRIDLPNSVKTLNSADDIFKEFERIINKKIYEKFDNESYKDNKLLFDLMDDIKLNHIYNNYKYINNNIFNNTFINYNIYELLNIVIKDRIFIEKNRHFEDIINFIHKNKNEVLKLDNIMNDNINYNELLFKIGKTRIHVNNLLKKIKNTDINHYINKNILLNNKEFNKLIKNNYLVKVLPQGNPVSGSLANLVFIELAFKNKNNYIESLKEGNYDSIYVYSDNVYIISDKIIDIHNVINTISVDNLLLVNDKKTRISQEEGIILGVYINKDKMQVRKKFLRELNQLILNLANTDKDYIIYKGKIYYKDKETLSNILGKLNWIEHIKRIKNTDTRKIFTDLINKI